MPSLGGWEWLIILVALIVFAVVAISVIVGLLAKIAANTSKSDQSVDDTEQDS